ncbi:MAG: hypothetical protein LBM93_09435 [Oscillospiraceae bacterium]|jgi:uncharacterized protein with PIN domain|nr:hypothetical protein [Oscillospiraceae bacterium]
MQIRKEVEIYGGIRNYSRDCPVCSECGYLLDWISSEVVSVGEIDRGDEFHEHEDWKFCPFCGKPLAAEGK